MNLELGSYFRCDVLFCLRVKVGLDSVYRVSTENECFVLIVKMLKINVDKNVLKTC